MGFGLKTTQATIAVTNTAQKVSSSAVDVQGLFLKAPAGNSGIVYVGGADVTAVTGIPVAAGAVLTLQDLQRNGVQFWDLSKIYVYGAQNDILIAAYAY